MGDTMRNRSAIIGYALLTLILTAGAAQGLAGTDTVTSDDIVNETLTSADVKNESLTSSDIKNESLRGSDILNNSLTGSDVNEAALALPNAYYAQIDSGGDREGGNAVGSDKEATGEYTVKFAGTDVRNCAWTGSEADFPGASSLVKSYVVLTDADSSSSEVTVHTTRADGVSVDASFALVGICP